MTELAGDDLCGSHSGYKRHRRGGEQPCQPCRDARNTYMREYERQRANKRPRVVPAVIPADMFSRTDLACRTPDANPEWWFADSTSPLLAKAIRICGGCVVRDGCRQYAVDNNIQHGVYGGTLPQQRTWIRKAANA